MQMYDVSRILKLGIVVVGGVLSVIATAIAVAAEPKFTAYKPNLVAFTYNSDDETPLQVRFSAKYTFLDCGQGEQGNGLSILTCGPFSDDGPLKGFGDLRVFFSYTTDFDFYVFSDGEGKLMRQSRPVRNRMTSPGLHFDWRRKSPKGDPDFRWSNFTLSFVHHSNGQELEFDTFFNSSSTEEDISALINELERNQPSWMDGVSRGWNYIELKGKFYIGKGTKNCDRRFKCVTLYADVKIPISEINDGIWWEPNNSSKFRDYNVTEFTISNEWGQSPKPDSSFLSFGEKEVSLQLQCGLNGCATKTWLRFDTYIGKGNFSLPLMLYGHFGKNEHFYNYHLNTNSVGLGVQFNP